MLADYTAVTCCQGTNKHKRVTAAHSTRQHLLLFHSYRPDKHSFGGPNVKLLDIVKCLSILQAKIIYLWRRNFF
jgi:hypothetical protein